VIKKEREVLIYAYGTFDINYNLTQIYQSIYNLLMKLKTYFFTSSCGNATSDIFRAIGEQLSGKSDTHLL